MNVKFLLSVALLMSRISVVQATVQCPISQKTIKGMFLRGHTFKTTKVGRPGVCYLMCEEELTCQSYNFVFGHKICELNNRTKEARPYDFKPDQTRFYMKRARNRGKLQFFFRVCLFKNAALWNAKHIVSGGKLRGRQENSEWESWVFFPSWLQHTAPQSSSLLLKAIHKSS